MAVAERGVIVEEPPAELVGPHVLDSLRQALGVGSPSAVSMALAECCDRALGFYLCFGLGACCSFLLEAHECVDHDVGVGEHVFDGGGGGVHAVLADGGGLQRWPRYYWPHLDLGGGPRRSGFRSRERHRCL